jgi:hypothetical protein
VSDKTLQTRENKTLKTVNTTPEKTKIKYEQQAQPYAYGYL